MSFDEEKTRDIVKALIAEQLNVSVDKVKSDDTFESLGADSLDRVEIVMKLEEHFNIEINDADAESIKTVNQLADYVVNRIDAKS